MDRFDWDRLNHLQVGRYAEYLMKMEFTRWGVSVFGAEVDDRGIDLVARTDAGRHYDVQVKSVRGFNYIFFRKNIFPLSEQMIAAIVLFQQGAVPTLYLVPSLTWESPNALFVSHDYEKGKSEPEWGLNLSAKNLPLLEPFAFDSTIRSIVA